MKVRAGAGHATIRRRMRRRHVFLREIDAADRYPVVLIDERS